MKKFDCEKIRKYLIKKIAEEKNVDKAILKELDIVTLKKLDNIPAVVFKKMLRDRNINVELDDIKFSKRMVRNLGYIILGTGILVSGITLIATMGPVGIGSLVGSGLLYYTGFPRVKQEHDKYQYAKAVAVGALAELADQPAGSEQNVFDEPVEDNNDSSWHF